MWQEPIDAARVHEALRSVMEREGIPREPEGPGAFTRWLADKFGSLFEGLGDSSDILVVVLGLLSLAFVIALLVSAVRGRGRRAGRWRGADARAGEPPWAVRLRVEELRARARAAERDGDLVLALRTHLFALVVGLGEVGDLEFRPTWTDRELLERGHPEPRVRDWLGGLLDELDPKTFGHQRVSVEDVRRLDGLSARVLSGELA